MLTKFRLDRDFYQEIEIDFLIEFAKKALTLKAKRLLGIRTPLIGKNRGKIFIVTNNYPILVHLYTLFPRAVSKGYKFDFRKKE